MKIAIACDHSAVSLKQAVMEYLTSRLIDFTDFGTDSTESCDYPNYAEKVCKAILHGNYDQGILICATGIGMSITANKFPGIRAAACSDPFSAIFAKRHNNANVLCLGQMIWGPDMAKVAVDAFLSTRFTEGLEGIADFLRDACGKVEAIRPQ